MQWIRIHHKRSIIIAHIALILAVLGSSEPFNKVYVSSWVILVGFAAMLVLYFIFRTMKLKYVPLVHLLVALGDIAVWVILAYTAGYWSNITGWDGLVYLIYPFLAAFFFILLLIMNLVVCVVKWNKAERKRT